MNNEGLSNGLRNLHTALKSNHLYLHGCVANLVQPSFPNGPAAGQYCLFVEPMNGMVPIQPIQIPWVQPHRAQSRRWGFGLPVIHALDFDRAGCQGRVVGMEIDEHDAKMYGPRPNCKISKQCLSQYSRGADICPDFLSTKTSNLGAFPFVKYQSFGCKILGTFGWRNKNSPTLQRFRISKKKQLFSLFGT